MKVRYTFDLRTFQVVKIFFPRKRKTYQTFFSIFDVKYFFNKRTVTKTFRNPVKYNYNSTMKTKKKNFLGFMLQDITP